MGKKLKKCENCPYNLGVLKCKTNPCPECIESGSEKHPFSSYTEAVVMPKNEKELGKAIKKGADCILLEGKLGKKAGRIIATGKAAWAVAIGAIGVAVTAIIIIIATGPIGAPVGIPVTTAGLAPAAAVFGGGTAGMGVATSAVTIAVAGGGVGTLTKLRGYKIEKKDDKVILRKK